MATVTHIIRLPWPPTGDSVWRRVGNRILLSASARRYREQVNAIVSDDGIEPFIGPVTLSVRLFPPDAAPHDAGRLMKALFGALQHADVYRDDHQVEKVDVTRAGWSSPGEVLVRVSGDA